MEDVVKWHHGVPTDEEFETGARRAEPPPNARCWETPHERSRPSVCSPPPPAQVAERLGLHMGRPNLEVFADTLLELAKAIRKWSRSRATRAAPASSARSGRHCRSRSSKSASPSRIWSASPRARLRRQEVVSPFRPACFLTARALEQIKNDVCYSDVPATVVGISAGVSYGALGSTHHSLHDLAALRAIHNIHDRRAGRQLRNSRRR